MLSEAYPLNTLAQLMLLPLEEVIEMVDNLGHYYILVEESVGEEVLISFRQRIIQLYSYDRLSLSKGVYCTDKLPNG